MERFDQGSFLLFVSVWPNKWRLSPPDDWQKGLTAKISQELAAKMAAQEAERERLSRESEEERRRDREAFEEVRTPSVQGRMGILSFVSICCTVMDGWYHLGYHSLFLP